MRRWSVIRRVALRMVALHVRAAWRWKALAETARRPLERWM